MAKMFGKRGKGRRDAPPPPPFDPRSSFAVAPIPRPSGPPASSTPLADLLNRGGPGVTKDYVVLPRSLAEQMPLPWQQHAAHVLAEFYQTHQHLNWPQYRVLPSREERLVDLDEEQLAEVGYVVEMDNTGELVYRERTGRKVENPEQKKVLVTCLDPVVPRRDPGAPKPETTAVPMNVGPEPKWDVVPNKAHQELPPSFAPGTQPDDTPTPPRGISMPSAQQPSSSENSGPLPAQNGTGPQEFGPTGEPIERPYRPDR